jgi:hypothetical protein
MSRLESDVIPCRRDVSCTGHLHIPLENLRAISHFIYTNGSFTDLLCFALTCSRCWDASDAYLTMYLAGPEVRCSWNGDRIICVGDYVESVPPWAEFTPAELRHIKRCKSLYYYPYMSKDGSEDDEEYASDDEEDEDYIPGRDGVFYSHWNKTSSELLSRSLDCVHYPRGSSSQRDDSRRLFDVLNLLKVAREQKIENPILRNLSKKIYVREFDVNQIVGTLDNPWDERMCLGDILLSQVCWSDQPDGTFEDVMEELAPWAGDRIDFVSEEDFPISIRELEGWKDEAQALVEMNIRLASRY